MTVGHRGMADFVHLPLSLQEHGCNKIKRKNIKLYFKLNSNSYCKTSNIEFDSSLYLIFAQIFDYLYYYRLVWLEAPFYCVNGTHCFFVCCLGAQEKDVSG
jgi:hypothetical protein